MNVTLPRSAARVLCEDGHDGRDYVLTGPESLTQRQQVEIIGDGHRPAPCVSKSSHPSGAQSVARDVAIRQSPTCCSAHMPPL
jgi:hypothetical protein